MKDILAFSLIVLFSLKTNASVFIVTDTTANSAFSFAFAIMQANSQPGRDTIEFNIPGTQNHLIVSDSLPPLTDSLFINGLSQPGNSNADLQDLILRLYGSRGLEIRSPGCSVNGLHIQTTSDGLSLLADSAKSIDSTFIYDCYFSSETIGINISPTSNYSLNSSGIFIDNVWSRADSPGSTGIYIYASSTADIRNISITNSYMFAGYLIFASFFPLNALRIDRQNNSVANPGYLVHGNHIGTNVELTGYLDGIYFQYDTLTESVFHVHDASINHSLFGSNLYHGGHFVFEDFIGDSIYNINIQANELNSVQLDFDFSGTNQFFDEIYFQNNILKVVGVHFQSLINLTDSQIIADIYFKDNIQDGGGTHFNFLFAGQTEISNIQINNNKLDFVGGMVMIQSDTNTYIKCISLYGNLFRSNTNMPIHLELNGNVDSVQIASDTLIFDDPSGHYGIFINSKGSISNLLIEDNFISIDGQHSHFGQNGSGILVSRINAIGNISHNTFSGCAGAGIRIDDGAVDSNTVLLIDSNVFFGSYRHAIEILSGPYNPPFEQIGTYTILGNSIYDIGLEGIYRFSQHDTLSCMNCIPSPQLLAAEYSSGTTTVHGEIAGDTLTNYIIEFFSNANADTGGFSEGAFIIHRDTILTDNTGHSFYSIDISGNYLNSYITATATSLASMQTSEFSNEVGVILGISESPANGSVKIYPNPSDIFHINSKAEIIKSIELSNSVGQLVYTRTITSKNITLDFSNFNGGIYFLKLNFDNYHEVQKITVR